MCAIFEIRKKIESCTTRSAWERGVQTYAVELLDLLAEHRRLTDNDPLTSRVTEKELLNGAKNWSQYSYGGSAEIYDEDICKRLCPPSIVRKKREGELPPSSDKTWLDVQAEALGQAARIVRRIANRDLE